MPIFVAFLLITLSQAAFPSSNNIAMTINGNQLESRATAASADGSVLAPLDLLKSLGAKYSLKNKGQKLAITLFSGKSFTCQTQLIQGRHMVSVDEIASKLGILTDYDENTSTLNMRGLIKHITFNGIEIRVAVSTPATAELLDTNWTRRANKLILDIKGIRFPEDKSALTIENSTSAPISTGLQNDGETARIALTLPSSATGKITSRPDSSEIVVSLAESTSESNADDIMTISDLPVLPAMPESPKESTRRAKPLLHRMIVIDPGHGGKFVGAVGPSGFYEKDCTLQIAERTQKLLAAKGATVFMTRNDDSSLDTDQREDCKMRADFAAKHSADLFISIHCNSCKVANTTSGTETYFQDENPDSKALAELIQDEMVKADGLPDRGIKPGPWTVLQCTQSHGIPGILIEVGFINNSVDESKLMDPSFQQKVAQAIVKGIKLYTEGNPIASTPVKHSKTRSAKA